MEDSKLVAQIQKYQKDPVSFINDNMDFPEGKSIAPDQIEVLNAIANNKRVSVRSGHGVGKSCGENFAVWWFLSCFHEAKIACTAPTSRQLKDILWSELKKWHGLFKLQGLFKYTATRIGLIGQEEVWNCIQRTATKPEALQGLHGDNFLFIIDEASGISPEIAEVIEGALTQGNSRLLMLGNPTQLNGVFFDSFHKDAGLYKKLHFSSENSVLVSKKYCENMAKKYGKDSDVYKVRVLGDFPSGDPTSFISLSSIEGAIARDVKWTKEEPISIGVDPARYGDDESVICYSVGLKVFPMITFRGINTTRLSGEVIQLIKQLRKDGYTGDISIQIDETGVGAGVVDILEEQAEELMVVVSGCNNGGKPQDAKEYYNLGSEMYGEIKEDLAIISLPDDDEIRGQVSTRKYTLTKDGKIWLEKKEVFKKRIKGSPDRGDALGLCRTKYRKSNFILEDYNDNDIDYLNESSRDEI